MELGSHLKDFHEIWYLYIFRKVCREHSNFIKSWQEWRILYMKTDIFQILGWEKFQAKVLEKIKIHILRTFENRAVYEIMWNNIVQPGRPQITIRRMRIVCWLTKATNIHSEYVIIIGFPRQQWLCYHASILRYTYHACLVIFYRESANSTLFLSIIMLPSNTAN
jgi:hypothetical protein